MTNKTDSIKLAETIFLQDISTPATQEVATEVVAEAAIWAARTFYAAVDKYESGVLDPHFNRLDAEREGLHKAEALVERRRAERRAAEVTEFDPIQHFMESLLRGIDHAKKAA